jgi:hypothetical protein
VAHLTDFGLDFQKHIVVSIGDGAAIMQNMSHLLETIDFFELNEINKIMLPIKLTVEALSRKDATLLSCFANSISQEI